MGSLPFSCHFCNATQLRLKVTFSQLHGTAKNVINVNQCAAQQKVRILGCVGVGEIRVVMC